MAKRPLKCRTCSGVLGKEQRQGEVCQYCQLKGKIDQEMENIQKLFEESGDPDLPRQLEELEIMASALSKKKEEEVAVKDEDIKPDVTNQGKKGKEEMDCSLSNDDSVVTNEEKENDEPEEEDIKPDLLVKEETDIDDEEYAKSLPLNWKAKNVKVGFGSIIKHFIDASGIRFVSRIDAIRTLGKLEDSQEDVDTLRSGLVADGWISHPLLPKGWVAKPVSKSSSGNNSLRFLTDKNEWFVGIKKAVRLLNNSEEYTGFHLENLHAFFGEYSSFKRETDESWLEGDEYLPDGWRYKVVHGNNGDYARVLSPKGESFSSKSKALAYMVKNNYEEADVKKMISALVYDGWVESSFLPSEWRYRKCKSGRNEYNFLSPEGEMFPSRRTLAAFMRSSEKYGEDDISNLDVLGEEIRAKWAQVRHDWIENDETVPQGWKIRYLDGVKSNGKPRKRCYILSPSGAIFQSRIKALQFMIQNSHPEDQIICMRSQSERENWVSHPMLPENWRIKRQMGTGHLFFSSEGLLLSLKSALSHVEQASDKYTAEDSDGLVFVAKSFTEENSKSNLEWLENETVPEGWRVRKEGKREYLLTPGGAEIGGRVKTIKFLLKQGYSLTHPDVNILRSGLSAVGWQEDTDIIPPGWMKKQVMITSKTSQQAIKKFKFISLDFKEFHSLAPVFHYMRANNFPNQVVNKVKEHLDIKSMLSNKRMPRKGNVSRNYKWKQTKYLPPGWRTALRQFRYRRHKQLFLSPNGLLLQKAVLAFQVMVEEGADNYYLGQMYQILRKEGWEEDASLPLGWRLNVDKEQFPDSYKEEELDVIFLTEKAQILTEKSALKFLTENGDEFSEDQISDFLGLVENLSNGFERGWKEDSALPVGWKIREIDLSFKKEWHVMSLEQEEFDSIYAAFIYMMNYQELYMEEDILKMKSQLSKEGFEENEKLPAGWRIIRNRGENLFELLSRDGILYQTLNAAQEFMEGSGDYDAEHVLEVEELCMAEVEGYLNNRVLTNPSFGKFVQVNASGDYTDKSNSEKKRKVESVKGGRKKRKYGN